MEITRPSVRGGPVRVVLSDQVFRLEGVEDDGRPWSLEGYEADTTTNAGFTEAGVAEEGVAVLVAELADVHAKVGKEPKDTAGGEGVKFMIGGLLGAVKGVEGAAPSEKDSTAR